ncbi:MAG: hypothetical protein ACYCPS_01200 [Candidatus Saccharimonadales bacterium]
MEELSYDFETEDDDEEEEDDPNKQIARPLRILEAIDLKPKPEYPEQQEEKPSKEILLKTPEEQPIDNAPELDAEAPLNYLSREEASAVTQTFAESRLDEILTADELELTSEELAAESFLENVQASGDVDQAYHETLTEIGETEDKTSAIPEESEAETALPPDPESLLTAAKDELAANITYRINRVQEPSQIVNRQEVVRSPNPRPERPPEREVKEHKLTDNVVDYLVGRRFGRISSESRQDVIENRLREEVGQIKLELSSRESHARELAKNKSLEKKRPPKRIDETETETIGRVLIDSELPERPVGHRNEKAGLSAHTMKRQELLKAASAIKVEGSSLKQIYEAHLVGERGLRRIIAEYLRGGNYIKTLKRELVEREKDFERDPKLRDQGSSQTIAPLSTELDKLLENTGIDWTEPQPAIQNPNVKANSLPSLLKYLKQSSTTLRRAADIALIGIIFTMAVVITVLILTR